jgi:integrase/recombinase XerD
MELTPTVAATPTAPEQSLRMEELLDAFIASQDIKESSKAQYRRTLRLFFRWIAGKGYRMQDVARPHLLTYKEELLAAGRSTLSVSSYITSVRLFYEWTEANRYYPNVAKGIRSPRRRRAFRKQPLSPEQCTQLLERMAAGSILRDYAIVNLLLRTGLRTIELTGLDAGDVQYIGGHRVLRIRGKAHHDKDNFVKLTAKAYEPIARYLNGANRAAGSPLFPSESNNSRGARMTTRTVSGIVKQALRDMGLDDRVYTAHSLRHTAIVNCRRAGATPEQAQAMARHASPATTQIYDSFFRDEQRLNAAAEDLIDTLY